MVRSELLQDMCNQHPAVLRKDMEKILEIFFDEIAEALCRGENIEIRGFGTYKVVKRKARIGRNPKTKEKKIISERNVILFKPSKNLKLYINKNEQ